MADQDIIQNMISELGQSQAGRLAAELQSDFVAIDERTPEALYRYVAALAPHIKHHGTNGNLANFSPFFPPGEPALGASDGLVPPHLGLLFAFLKLYEAPRRVLNGFVGRHLDFYYRQVLGFEPRPAIPDRAHVVLELKKNVSPVRVLPTYEFSAGKDAIGVERIYQPVRETVINAARVAELRSVYVDPAGRGTIRAASVANSKDGVGGELPPDQPSWKPFGHEQLPIAPFGFALSSPVLRMREGERKVTLTLGLAGALSAAPPAGTFEAFVTGDKGWLGPFAVDCQGTRDLTLGFTLDPSTGPVVDYAASVHLKPFVAEAPVVQLLLKQPGAFGYEDLRALAIVSVRIRVNVQKLTSLTLESDAGTLDPKKVFLPFGSQPRRGSRFQVGCSEALSKNLDYLSLRIRWHAKPADFASYYQGYGPRNLDAQYFKASVIYRDAAHQEKSFTTPLFAAAGGDPNLTEISTELPRAPVYLPLNDARQVYELRSSGSLAAFRSSAGYLRALPRLDLFAPPPPQLRSEFITLQLDQDMLLDEFRNATISALLDAAKGAAGATVKLPNPPYIPAIESIELKYGAAIDAVDLQSHEVAAFASAQARFFHVDAFGVRREHGYLRSLQGAHVHAAVPLLPEHPWQGELLIGLRGLAADDSVSMLCQGVAGSADPEIAWPEISWHALCDNYWKPLGSDELVLDTTRALRSSGLVVVMVPREATAANTLLPSDRVWFKAQAHTRDNASRLSQLVTVASNALEVQFRDRGNDPAHAAAALPAGSITRVKTPLPALKSVVQPYASFDGEPRELDTGLRLRAAERLRHKDRCITPWDYERSALGAFPELERVKCIPHARPGVWHAPGHVLVIVVPSLSRGVRDPREPKADQETLARVTEYLQARCGMQLELHAQNPRYQRIRLRFAVKFRRGYEFNAYRTLLEQELIAFLSPWLGDSGAEYARTPSFGGKVYRSVLVDFVEERPYVEYVRDFAMHSLDVTAADLSEVSPTTPDAILVSDAGHDIQQAS